MLHFLLDRKWRKDTYTIGRLYVNGEFIRIHRGNTAEDSAGCVIVGENTSKGRLTNSTKYELQITEMVKKADFAYITII